MPDVFAGRRRVPRPENDPNLSYAPGTPARAELKSRLKQMAAETIDIPIIIGGREIRSGTTERSVMPHKHSHVLANFQKASPEHVRQAALAGSDCATLPPKVFAALYKHELTDAGIESFLKDWKSTGQSIL